MLQQCVVYHHSCADHLDHCFSITVTMTSLTEQYKSGVFVLLLAL